MKLKKTKKELETEQDEDRELSMTLDVQHIGLSCEELILETLDTLIDCLKTISEKTFESTRLNITDIKLTERDLEKLRELISNLEALREDLSKVINSIKVKLNEISKKCTS